MDLIVEVLPLLGLRLPDLVATQGFNLSLPPLELMLPFLVCFTVKKIVKVKKMT